MISFIKILIWTSAVVALSGARPDNEIDGGIFTDSDQILTKEQEKSIDQTIGGDDYGSYGLKLSSTPGPVQLSVSGNGKSDSATATARPAGELGGEPVETGPASSSAEAYLEPENARVNPSQEPASVLLLLGGVATTPESFVPAFEQVSPSGRNSSFRDASTNRPLIQPDRTSTTSPPMLSEGEPAGTTASPSTTTPRVESSQTMVSMTTSTARSAGQVPAEDRYSRLGTDGELEYADGETAAGPRSTTVRSTTPSATTAENSFRAVTESVEEVTSLAPSPSESTTTSIPVTMTSTQTTTMLPMTTKARAVVAPQRWLNRTVTTTAKPPRKPSPTATTTTTEPSTQSWADDRMDSGGEFDYSDGELVTDFARVRLTTTAVPAYVIRTSTLAPTTTTRATTTSTTTTTERTASTTSTTTERTASTTSTTTTTKRTVPKTTTTSPITATKRTTPTTTTSTTTTEETATASSTTTTEQTETETVASAPASAATTTFSTVEPSSTSSSRTTKRARTTTTSAPDLFEADDRQSDADYEEDNYDYPSDTVTDFLRYPSTTVRATAVGVTTKRASTAKTTTKVPSWTTPSPSEKMKAALKAAVQSASTTTPLPKITTAASQEAVTEPAAAITTSTHTSIISVRPIVTSEIMKLNRKPLTAVAPVKAAAPVTLPSTSTSVPTPAPTTNAPTTSAPVPTSAVAGQVVRIPATAAPQRLTTMSLRPVSASQSSRLVSTTTTTTTTTVAPGVLIAAAPAPEPTAPAPEPTAPGSGLVSTTVASAQFEESPATSPPRTPVNTTVAPATTTAIPSPTSTSPTFGPLKDQHILANLIPDSSAPRTTPKPASRVPVAPKPAVVSAFARLPSVMRPAQQGGVEVQQRATPSPVLVNRNPSPFNPAPVRNTVFFPQQFPQQFPIANQQRVIPFNVMDPFRGNAMQWPLNRFITGARPPFRI